MADPVIRIDFFGEFHSNHSLMEVDHYYLVFSNWVPEVSVILKKQTLSRKTRFKLRL